MGGQLWSNPLISAVADGPTIVNASAQTCLPAAARWVAPSNFFTVGKVLRITASGRISCAAATPGTARFDVRLGTGGGAVVMFDSLAIPLNVAGKTGASWLLQLVLTCRSGVGGTSQASLFGQGLWTSDAGVGGAAAAGPASTFALPVNASPAAGAFFDSTAALPLDLFFTQTVTTGSLTLHQYLLEEIG